MTTEPGHLPCDYDELDLNLMSDELRETVIAVKSDLNRFQHELSSEKEQEAKEGETEDERKMREAKNQTFR